MSIEKKTEWGEIEYFDESRSNQGEHCQHCKKTRTIAMIPSYDDPACHTYLCPTCLRLIATEVETTEKQRGRRE